MGDEDSLNHSRATREMLNLHIQKTELQLDQVTSLVRMVVSILKWAGGLIVSLLLTVLGWSVVQQFNANEAQKHDLQRQIQLLSAQREVEALRASRAESAATSDGVIK
jgi:hypothetical protein